MFGADTVTTLEDIHVERWASDPFHYGLFSTWPIPANAPGDSMRRLAGKVGKVFFVNHASDPFIGMTSGNFGAVGTVMQLLPAYLRGEVCPQYEPDMSVNFGVRMENDKLYTCIGVRVPKGEGKTRKGQSSPDDDDDNFALPYGRK